MKKITCLLLLLLTFCLGFAQDRNPVAKGFITIVTGQKMVFSNLRFVGEQVIFYNSETESEFTYFLNSIKLIEDENVNVIYSKIDLKKKNTNFDSLKTDGKSVESDTIKKTKLTPLMFINAGEILRKDRDLTPDEVRYLLKTNSEALEKYNTGRTLVSLGNVSLGLGIGFIIGGGIINLNKANDRSNQYSSKSNNDFPNLVIPGVIIGLLAIPLKITGRNEIEESIETYNKNLTAFRIKETKLIYNQNGLGICLQF